VRTVGGRPGPEPDSGHHRWTPGNARGRVHAQPMVIGRRNRSPVVPTTPWN